MIKVGDKIYALAHCYYHILGEVSEVLGVRRVALKNAVQVHSCQRNWTLFFADGFRSDTNFDVIGDVPDIGYMYAVAWNHEIPKARKK